LKILFLSRYTNIMASARYRVYYISQFMKKQYRVKTKILAFEKHAGNRFYNFIRRRIMSIYSRYICKHYDVIYFHKYIDYDILLKCNKKVILSIDDIPSDEFLEINPNLIFLVLCGSTYIQDLFDKKHFKTMFYPTMISKNFLYKRVNNNSVSSTINISWIGSSKGDVYIQNILPLLSTLKSTFVLNIVTSKKIFDKNIIKDYNFVNFIEWKLKDEYIYFDEADIILMPLDNTDRSFAKGGFKILQGMYRGAVPIAFNTEANRLYVRDGYNGFLYNNNDEFLYKIKLLMNNTKLLNKFRNNSYKLIDEHGLYSEKQIKELMWILRNMS